MEEIYRSSSHNFKFLFRRIGKFNLQITKDELPICLEEKEGKYKLLIDKKQMNEFKNEFELINILGKIL